MGAMFSLGLKVNTYVDNVVLTVIMRYSEAMSGVDTFKEFGVHDDILFASDYGFTEKETKNLIKSYGF